jgi:hypothetical protein
MMDKLNLVKRYVNDKKVSVGFTQMIDASGSNIIAKVYNLLDGTEVAIVNSLGFSTIGGLKGEYKEVFCDFTGLAPFDKYSIKFYTEDEGVIAKAPLLIYGLDAFSTLFFPSVSVVDITPNPQLIDLTDPIVEMIVIANAPCVMTLDGDTSGLSLSVLSPIEARITGIPTEDTDAVLVAIGLCGGVVGVVLNIRFTKYIQNSDVSFQDVVASNPYILADTVITFVDENDNVILSNSYPSMKDVNINLT